MIKESLELLQRTEYNGDDEDIRFAKGSHELPTTWKKLKNYLKMRYGR